MKIANMPFCCTSAVMGSLGEHGEPSVVNQAEIKRLMNREMEEITDLGGHKRGGFARCMIVTTVDEINRAQFLEYGFKEVDSYDGVQGRVHILTFHA